MQQPGDYFELMACRTAQHNIAQESDKAMLLPSIYDDFVQRCMASKRKTTVGESKAIPSLRWLMSRLHSIFGDMLVVECRQIRYGSVVYLDGCDFVQTISCLLGKQKHSKLPKAQKEEKPSCTLSTERNEELSFINKRLHKQARKLVDTYNDTPDKYKKFSLECLDKDMDPVLIDFIERITQSLRRNKRPSDSTIRNTTKHTRQMYALSVLLFTVDTTCTMPRHMHAAC